MGITASNEVQTKRGGGGWKLLSRRRLCLGHWEGNGEMSSQCWRGGETGVTYNSKPGVGHNSKVAMGTANPVPPFASSSELAPLFVLFHFIRHSGRPLFSRLLSSSSPAHFSNFGVFLPPFFLSCLHLLKNERRLPRKGKRPELKAITLNLILLSSAALEVKVQAKYTFFCIQV